MDRATFASRLCVELRWLASGVLLSLCATTALAGGGEAAAIRSGTLVFTVAEGEPVQIPRLRTDVKVDISGIVARVEVRQRFRNPSAQWAEGIYAFPLPEHAGIERLSTVQDGKLVRDVRRKVSTQRLYDEIRGAAPPLGAAPRRHSLLRAPIADIPPRATLDITITYLQIIDHGLDRQRLRVPLAANRGPIPDLSAELGQATTDADGSWVQIADRPEPQASGAATQAVSVRVCIDAGFPLAGIVSRNHPIQVLRGEHATITANSENAAADADFVLEWGPDTRKFQRMPLARAVDDAARLLRISAD